MFVLFTKGSAIHEKSSWRLCRNWNADPFDCQSTALTIELRQFSTHTFSELPFYMPIFHFIAFYKETQPFEMKLKYENALSTGLLLIVKTHQLHFHHCNAFDENLMELSNREISCTHYASHAYVGVNGQGVP